MKHKFVLLLAIVALFGCLTGVFFLVKSGKLSDFLENNKIILGNDKVIKIIDTNSIEDLKLIPLIQLAILAL